MLMSLLTAYQLDAIIIDHDDPHSTEIPHPAFGALEFVSNFSGSWGKAVVSRENAWLWTDSRYYIQAAQQLSPPWELMRYGQKDVPDVVKFLKEKPFKRVGIDASTTPHKVLTHYKDNLKDIEFVELHDNPIYKVWEDRPQLPVDPVFVHPETFTGMSAADKLAKIRDEMDKAGANAVVFSLLDEVAYVLNLRGRDLDVSPLFYAYLVVEKDNATLFIDSRKVTDDVKKALTLCNVARAEYSELPGYLASISGNAEAKNPGDKFKLWVSPSASVAICNSFLSNASEKMPRELLQENTPACIMKAVKNDVELEGMKEAHVLDGIALAEFFAKVEGMKSDASLFKSDEMALGDLSTQCRADIKENRGISFHPISSIGPNCAIVHYRATEESKVKIEPQMYLLDSGGQYGGGTTDVTRTVHFGTPSAEEKESYTQVLKGHLALRHAVFPEQTPGASLDVLARQFLWNAGRNYYHGTGHGVGAYLNVHEGPMSISSLMKPRMGNVNVVYLEPGMVVSNEPGYYKEDHYGIRIENMVYVRRVMGDFSKDYTKFLTFEDLTLVPYCKDLMDLGMMTEQEVEWVNEYHALIAATLIPRMEALSTTKYADAIKFLREAAIPLRK
ncbi:metallopeptidase M24 family protein [Babesia ovata]|uniref:Metallopeptidase M24 family protein n=1 Tax=Babesia ovata TaxID=189622 RepID=A0A2H6K6W2_9APIC|nr:metallopeptidase M24 family protein [Babesia ovata]GBE58712.1 metallopeptidase M24 family protein [Babesia ovata]